MITCFVQLLHFYFLICYCSSRLCKCIFRKLVMFCFKLILLLLKSSLHDFITLIYFIFSNRSYKTILIAQYYIIVKLSIPYFVRFCLPLNILNCFLKILDIDGWWVPFSELQVSVVIRVMQFSSIFIKLRQRNKLYKTTQMVKKSLSKISEYKLSKSYTLSSTRYLSRSYRKR